MKPQFLIGSVSTGGGKTIFAMGLLRLFKKRHVRVQSFKSGPNFMDVQLHSMAGISEAINLDSFLASRTRLQSLYNSYGEGADVCFIEGSAALFDGYKRMHGSSAELSQVLSVPVVLVVNARSASYSLAPVLYGFKRFNSNVNIVGVVFNQVSSTVHYSYLKDACNDAGLQCFGFIPYDESLQLPAAHTALTHGVKAGLDKVVEKASNYIANFVDVESLLKHTTRIFPCPYTLPYTSDIDTENMPFSMDRQIRIGVARDAAFNFIYKENLDCLNQEGRIQYFSPLYSNELPNVDLIYLPGGYPELFARQLHRRKAFLTQLRDYVEDGGKIWAEGGAIALLSRTLTIRSGTAYEMSGALPLECSMVDTRLRSGYRCTKIGNSQLNGHEFRYLSVTPVEISSDTLTVADTAALSAIKVFNVKGVELDTPLYRYKNVIAGCTHWEWARVGLSQLFFRF